METIEQQLMLFSTQLKNNYIIDELNNKLIEFKQNRYLLASLTKDDTDNKLNLEISNAIKELDLLLTAAKINNNEMFIDINTKLQDYYKKLK